MLQIVAYLRLFCVLPLYLIVPEAVHFIRIYYLSFKKSQTVNLRINNIWLLISL